ncbi:glycoside hydrolase family 3 protein [Alicyclobacillus pomorum]|uniref:glycoside hydrolase family 3 protein n=1 Tax=Alicyclobacillus pomorum TaxID=204470 RepID=UPI0006852F98|nr:glycoside hydrolase family 3 protein [Alicyclobacillus pomorum]
MSKHSSTTTTTGVRAGLCVLTMGALLWTGLGNAVAQASTNSQRWQDPNKTGWKDDAAHRGWIESKIRHMTLVEKIGQMFITYAYGDSASTTNPQDVAANQKEFGVDNGAQLVQKYHLGGVIYFSWSDNLSNPTQIANLSNGLQRAAMSERLPIPLLVPTDQEQGLVTRIGPPATQFPGNMALGAARNPEYAYDAAHITGTELRAMGIHQDNAPDTDVNVNPANPVIGVRSFGSNPDLVALLGSAAVQGYQDAGVAATAKHFPGHGDTDTDSHTGLPIITHTLDQLNNIDLPPFKAAIQSGVDVIMSAHIVVPALDNSGRPATLSKPILTGLLRDKLGYDGVIETDSLQMQGVRALFGDDRVPVEAIQAGADLLLMPEDLNLAITSVENAVKSGEISEKRIDQSVYRILRLKYKLGLFQNPYVDTSAVGKIVGTPQNLQIADAITNQTITLLKDDDHLLPLQPNSGKKVLVTGYGVNTANTLARSVGQYGVITSAYATGSSPDDITIHSVVQQAQQNDVVVVSTYNAASYLQQQKLVQALEATGKPVIVVAVGNPYDIAYLPGVKDYLATYSDSPVSLKAVARVVFGIVNPSGKLPVDIPAASDANATLYPFGFGMSYP